MRNKKRLIIIVVFVFILGIFGLFSDDDHPDLLLKEENIVMEFGNRLSANLIDYVDTSIYDDQSIIEEIEYSSDDIKNFSSILGVGDYSITYKLRDTEKTLQVSVKDTTAPNIFLLNDVSVFENNKPNYEGYIKVEELSHYNVYIDDQDVKYNTPGNYQCHLRVVDDYDNEKSLDVPVEVKEVQLKVSQSNMTLTKNNESKIKITTNSHNPITYTSNYPDIVSVDSSGIIKAKKSGSAVVTAEVDGKKVSCHVNVTEPKKTTKKQETTTQKSVTTKSNNVSYTVYRTKTGSKYHRDGCRYLSRSQIAISKSDAVSMGLTPCSICQP